MTLLYRLPLAGTEERVLVVGAGIEGCPVFDPSSQRAAIVRSEPNDLMEEATFDAVALPGSLTAYDPSRACVPALRQPACLLRQAYAALRPGGVVIGHFEPLASVHGILGLLRGRVAFGSWAGRLALVSGSSCHDALIEAGFVEPECFYVEPRIESPMVLVPLHRHAARLHFLRAIRRTQEQYSGLGYLLRMALAHVGLGGFLQPHVFFWARRPC